MTTESSKTQFRTDQPIVPSISVIICTWNRAESLRATLESLAQQESINPTDVEILIVDNNSSDHTRALVEEIEPRWTLGSLRYVFEGRQGKQYALNTGVLAARGEVLAFTDDDILFAVDWLQNINRLFLDPGVDLAGGKTLIGWGDVPRPPWYRDDMQAVLGGVDDGEDRADPAPKSFAPGGGNLIARRSTFDRFGLYSEIHFRHMDHEFGMRCHAKGGRVVYDPTLVVWAPVDQRCLTPRYFERWSFKSGIATTGGMHAAGQFPKVPLWMYRRFLEDGLSQLLASSSGPAERFAQRMRLWRDYGAITNAWRAWLMPKTHAEWVKARSQKINGLY